MPIIKNKVVIASDNVKLQTIDNLEDNFYYAFKNGSNYYYTKSKASGSTTYYEFTYSGNVLSKITSKGSVTVSLNANGVPQITVSSTIYTLDETKNDYYIVNAEQVVPTAKAATQDLTTDDLNRIFEDFYVNPNIVKRYTGNDAFVYRTSASGGFTITGDYNPSTPRTLWIQGKMAHLNFTCKGTAVAYGATWTYLGTIPAGKRPKYQLTIVGMVYNGNDNEAAGGYITTSGDVVLWTNAKPAGNNYQARVACSYEIED